MPTNLHERHNVSPKNVPKVIGSQVLSHAAGNHAVEGGQTRRPRDAFASRPSAPSRGPSPATKRRLQETIDYFRPIQQAQTAELIEMLGRPFPEWTTLYGEAQAE